LLWSNYDSTKLGFAYFGFCSGRGPPIKRKHEFLVIRAGRSEQAEIARSKKPNSRLAEIAGLRVGVDDVAGFIVNAHNGCVKYWEIIACNLKQRGWSLGYVSAVDSQARTIWIVDAHGYGKRFIARSDEKLTAFLELEAAVRG
jgi:hypothetical protein